MTDTATYTTIDVVPLSRAIGAQVMGLDLRETLSAQQADDLRAALARHLVLFFRQQDLGEDKHVAFARNFGPVFDPYLASDPRPASERIFVTVEDTPDSPPKADHWHTDVPFKAEPPDIAVLNMRVAPPFGGDTLWVDLRAVHDALSPVMQDILAGLEIEVGVGVTLRSAFDRDEAGDARYRRALAEEATVRHPLVRVHPVTGRRAIYYPGGAFARGIPGLHPDESDALLAIITAHLDDPNLQCRWRWQQHDVVMWDERCTNHRAVGDHYPNHRVVRRCLVGWDKPVGIR